MSGKKTTTTTKATTAKAGSARARQLAALAEQVRQRLGLETLEDRGRDHLDFHDVAVASIREILTTAFEAGYAAGLEAAAASAPGK